MNIYQMREDYIKDVSGLTLADKEKIGWLVYADERFTDEEKPYSERERYREYKAYYVFTGNGMFFRYTPVGGKR